MERYTTLPDYSFYDSQLNIVNPGGIADSIIDLLDVNWSKYSQMERDTLIAEAEYFHSMALGFIPGHKAS